MPEGTNIVGCTFDVSRQVVLLLVEHPELPPHTGSPAEVPEYCVHVTQTAYKSEYKPR